MKTKHCQWCDNTFETEVSYQIYCSVDCRESATKEKIAERYQKTRRNRMMKKARHCQSCNAKLSAYNDESLCQACLINPKEVMRALKEIKGIANGKDNLTN
jgi:hypothetical protein